MFCLILVTWTSGKLPFDCQKIAKNLTFFPKKLPKIVIFSKKNYSGNLFQKMTIFGNSFFKFQVLAIFLHSIGNFPEDQDSITVFSFFIRNKILFLFLKQVPETSDPFICAEAFLRTNNTTDNIGEIVACFACIISFQLIFS